MENKYDEFYKELISALNQRKNEFPEYFKIPNHQSQRAYLGYSTGISDIRYYTEYTSRGYGGNFKGFIVGLYMEGKLYKQRLDYFEMNKFEIESLLDSSIVWLDTGKAGRIFFRYGEKIENKDKWKEIIQWEIDTLKTIVNVFQPHIDKLKKLVIN